MAYRDSQNAPNVPNSTPANVFPMRNWRNAATSWVSPPNIRATPKTTGRTPMLTIPLLTMLSMNVVTANAARASGAELPHFTASPEAATASAGTRVAPDGCRSWSMEAI